MDAIALQLRKHCAELPVVYFAEWVDQWSIGHLFAKVFPQDIALPELAGDAFEMRAYPLPDRGELERHLGLTLLQFSETEWLVARVKEALESWREVVPQSLLLLLREVVGGSVADEEVEASRNSVPNWVSELCRDAV